MILIIPSLEFRNGDCCEQISGIEGTESFYRSLMHNPLELVKLWRKENSKSLHIIDQDSFTSNENLININSILYISQSIDIPIQLYSRIDEIDYAKICLENGIYRVILSDLLMNQKDEVAKLVEQYTASRVIFGFTGKNYRVYFPCLDEEVPLELIFKNIKEIGGTRIIYSDATWRDNNVDFDFLTKLTSEYRIKMTIKDCVKDVNDLWNLNNYERLGIDSVILGQSLYKNNFACQQIWRLIEAKLEAEK